MKIIPEALELARLQRTSMTEEAIIKSYKQDCKEVEANLPVENCIGRVLDIGCGIAGWLCCLPDYANPEIYLIDKTQVDKDLYYGFKPKTSFYNSMDIAKKNLIENGIKKCKIFMHEADNTIPFKTKFDLIVSFISCGFHYPIETYLDQIYEKLTIGGVFIVDLRLGTEGLRAGTNKFGNHEVIRETRTYQRVVFRK